MDMTAAQNARLQPFPNQAPQGAVLDALAPHGQAPPVVHLGEDALAIGFDQGPIRPVLAIEGEVADRLQRSSPGALAIATRQPLLLIDGHQQLRAGPWPPRLSSRAGIPNGLAAPFSFGMSQRRTRVAR
jgi:hypothetical protein